jgi:hypothetical protein
MRAKSIQDMQKYRQTCSNLIRLSRRPKLLISGSFQLPENWLSSRLQIASGAMNGTRSFKLNDAPERDERRAAMKLSGPSQRPIIVDVLPEAFFGHSRIDHRKP